MNSKEKRKQSRSALRIASDQLSDEIWERKWEHVADLKVKPVGECIEIIRELERRCPGHTQEEYQDVIARSMFTNR